MLPGVLVCVMLLWILVTIGLVYIVVRSDIFEPVRVRLTAWKSFLAGLLACDRCSGFWMGLVAWLPSLLVVCWLTGQMVDWLGAFAGLPVAAVAGAGLEDAYCRIAPPEDESGDQS